MSATDPDLPNKASNTFTREEIEILHILVHCALRGAPAPDTLPRRPGFARLARKAQGMLERTSPKRLHPPAPRPPKVRRR